VPGCSEGRTTASTTEGLLAGRLGLVTGGAAGIGRATVERFLAEKARVVVDVDDALELATRPDVTLIAGDATQSATVAQAFAAVDELGELSELCAADSLEGVVNRDVARVGDADCQREHGGNTSPGTRVHARSPVFG